MKHFSILHFSPIVILACCIEPAAAHADSATDGAALTATISTLDTRVFDAYNQCDLATFGSYFTPTVEFYHDQGGATFDRKSVLANTKKYICHKVRRELMAGTLKVYPIKGYGAIEEGEHRFCRTESGQCEGIAKFVMIWRLKGAQWRLTRVMSYGHRALADTEKDALGTKPGS